MSILSFIEHWAEELFFPLVVIAICTAVQWPVIFYYDVKGAIISGIIISFITSFAIVVFQKWAKGHNPTGYSSGDAITEFSTFAAVFLGCLALIAAVSYGLLYLVHFYKTGILEKRPFFIWLGIFLGIPFVYLVVKEYRLKRMVKRHNEKKNNQ